MSVLEMGQTAPPFTLTDQDGKPVSLSDHKGRKVLLYFYPKADTPGCTKQSCSVRDARRELKTLAVDVLGISPDAPEEQKKFDLKYSLGFPLLSDAGRKTAEAYGALSGSGIVRSSFLIDEEGKILRAWYQVKPEDTVPNARQALASLGASMAGY